MLLLAKAVLAFMMGFLIAIVLGLILIPLLKKLNVKQTVSVFLSSKHKEKQGTPTMGGLIFVIATIIAVIFLFATNSLVFTSNLAVVLFVFLAYALLGLADDYIIIKRKTNRGLSELQKLFWQLLIAVVFCIIFLQGGREPTLEIFTLGITIHMGWFYPIFIMFMLVASSNAVNITDGLDGLAGGLSAIAFLTFGMVSFASLGIAGHNDVGIFCFILVGALLAFQFYNSHPAKVFMGDTGSLALGGTLAAIAIVNSNEIAFIIVAGVFVINTLACILQILSIRIRKKKLFLMTPLHHHFEKLGWHERDIVKLFWALGILLSALVIVWGVWI